MARVVVIGAGLSGLAAAARLARLGHDVILCERSSGPGGQAGRYERDGFAFDTGPTTLTMPASYRDLFVKTGKTTPLENYLDLQPVDAVRWHFWDGTTLHLPNSSRAGVWDAIGAAFGPDAAQAWEEFLRSGAGVWDRFRRGFLDGPPALSGRRFRVPAEEKATLTALNPDRSYHNLTIRHLGRWPHLVQAALSWPARLGTDPLSASSGMVLWPFLDHTFGTWIPAGGVRALVDVVAERAASRGASIRYNTEVTGLQIDAGKVGAVHLRDGSALPADVVVGAVDDRVLSDWIAPQPSPQTCETKSAFTLLLALRGTDDTPLQRICVSETTTDWNPVVTRASAPNGFSAYTVTDYATADLCGAPRDHEHRRWDDHEAACEASRLIAFLDMRGFDVSGRLLWSEVRSPRDLAHATGSADGATGGRALVGRNGLVRPTTATGIGGLFHVGATAHPGPGIAFAPLGAALVADAVGRAR